MPAQFTKRQLAMPAQFNDQHTTQCVHRVGTHHLFGSMPQLRSWNDLGLTVYAVSVHGVNAREALNSNATRSALGAATIYGPAVDSAGIADWPYEMRKAAHLELSKHSLRQVGAVIAITAVQLGDTAHYAVVRVPSRSRTRAKMDSAVPYACAASVLD